MASDTYGSILGLIQQATGNNNNSWGVTFNNSFATPDERAIAGVNTITTAGGTLDLSTTVPPAGLRLDIDAVQLVTSTLTSDLTIKVPNVSKTWWFINLSNNAYNVFVQVPGGVSPSGLKQLPYGKKIAVICDGAGNLYRTDAHDVGTLVHSAATSAPQGTLVCNGASLLRTEYPDLYNAIGTTWGSVDGSHFTLPNFQDTNRFLRAAGGSGPAVGTYQSNQNQSHTHTQASGTISGTTDSQGSHSHSASSSDSGHTHSLSPNPQGLWGSGGNANFGTIGGAGVSAGTVAVGYANVSTSIGAAGAHTHNVSGSATVTLNSQGGTEARPESAAVLICICY